jgi:hypothetical protein
MALGWTPLTASVCQSGSVETTAGCSDGLGNVGVDCIANDPASIEAMCGVVLHKAIT